MYLKKVVKKKKTWNKTILKKLNFEKQFPPKEVEYN